MYRKKNQKKVFMRISNRPVIQIKKFSKKKVKKTLLMKVIKPLGWSRRLLKEVKVKMRRPQVMNRHLNRMMMRLNWEIPIMNKKMKRIIKILNKKSKRKRMKRLNLSLIHI